MAAASLLRSTSAAAKKWNPTFTSQLLPHSPQFAPNYLSQSSKLNRNFPPTAATSLLRFTSAAASNWNQTSTSQLPQFALNFLSESSNLSGNLIPNSTISISNPKSNIRDEKTSSIEVIAETIEKALNALRKPALASSGGRMGGSDFSSRSSRSSGSSLSSRSSGSSSSSLWSNYSSSLRRNGSNHYQYDSNRPEFNKENRPEFNKEEYDRFIKFLKKLIGYFIGFLISALGLMILVVYLTSEKATVLKLQVGVRATTSSIQKDLNRIANDADTSTRAGFHYVLKETTQALLRDRDHCISGYSSADVKKIDGAERRFKKLSNEERAKFDKETLVNVNNVKRKTKGTTTQDGIAFSNEYVVVTILVAVEGRHKLPTINGSGDLKEALQMLALIPANKLKAVEVLWAPQMVDDTLSEQELRKDYPLLKRL